MFIKALKRLGALMLPVFAASITDAAISAISFFAWRVLVNVLGALVALLVNLVCFWIDANIYHRFTRAVESAFKEMLDMDRPTRAQGMQKTEYNRKSSKVRRARYVANYYDQ